MTGRERNASAANAAFARRRAGRIALCMGLACVAVWGCAWLGDTGVADMLHTISVQLGALGG